MYAVLYRMYGGDSPTRASSVPGTETTSCATTNRRSGAVVRLWELAVQRRIVDRREDGGNVLLVEAREAAECAPPAVDHRAGERQPQVALDLRRRARDGTRVADVGLHALSQRRIRACEIHVRVECARVIGRIAMRRVDALLRPEHSIEDRERVLPLEPTTHVESRRVERRG